MNLNVSGVWKHLTIYLSFSKVAFMFLSFINMFPDDETCISFKILIISAKYMFNEYNFSVIPKNLFYVYSQCAVWLLVNLKSLVSVKQVNELVYLSVFPEKFDLNVSKFCWFYFEFLIYIYIYIYKVPSISFQTFLYRHLKLAKKLENSVCYCYTSYEMTE